MTDNTITTIADFEKIVSNIRSGTLYESYWELFRGQPKNTYELKSGISRYAEKSDDLRTLEFNIMKEFRQLINKSANPEKFIYLSKSKSNYENDWRWFEQIQHYRLPTRLIDWTTNPKVALFFAVKKNFDDDAQFWIFKSPLSWSCDNHFDFNPFANNLDIISNSSFYIKKKYEDKIAEKRRGFQDGKFTIQDYDKSLIPLEKQAHIRNRLIKYIIPYSYKKKFLDYLKKSNITEDTIYVQYDSEIENLILQIKRKYDFK